ncbi:hypothetical protein FISHEDRAFT_71910 [Fistulina hepatica ATCC 64428]|uniref:Uncharacterized protein n=1 Tax=Fistulina hepatica ATCC 64428 TaxID=1128425 RepID=A0A0D7AGQ9_9AGAR|nr:hypothetical protein FISHEDRAFT_71910 [Fistulina hepatica ATCC 64428]
MAKSRKPEHGTQPITSFFQRVPTRSSQASSSTPTSAQKPILSKVLREAPSFQDACIGGRTRSKGHNTSTSALKRIASPGLLQKQTPEKPKAKFQDDPDVPDSVIYVQNPIRSGSRRLVSQSHSELANITGTRGLGAQDNERLSPDGDITSQTGSRKRARLSSPSPVEDEMVIPSSQSDEMRVDYSTSDSCLSQPSTSAKELDATSDTNMDVHASSPLSSPPTLRFSSPSLSGGRGEVWSRPTTPSPIANANGMMDFMDTSVANLEAEGTDVIIARMKAEAALAAAKASPKREFKDKLDSDDDDDLFIDPFANMKKNKGKQPEHSSHSVSSTSASTAVSEEFNFSMAGRRVSNRTRHAPPRAPVILTGQSDSSSRRLKAKSNPLDAMLREKRQADRGGRGEEAIRHAEEVVRAGRSALMDEISEELGFNDDWDTNTRNSSFMFTPDEPSRSLSFSDADRARLFDLETGESIGKILQTDKEELEHRVVKVLGVPFWSAEVDDSMTGVTLISTSAIVGEQPFLRSLVSAIADEDWSCATLLLQSGQLSVVDMSRQGDVLDFLWSTALSALSPVAVATFHALRSAYRCPQIEPAPLASFNTCARCLVRLGVLPSSLASVGWSTEVLIEVNAVGEHNRLIVLSRMLDLLQSARKANVRPEEVADFVALLVLIGTGNATTEELLKDVMAAIDSFCDCLIPREVPNAVEVDICNRLLAFLSHLTAVNQVYAATLLNGGSIRSQRIARWVAFAILTGRTVVENYSDLPPLENLVELFGYGNKKVSSHLLFKITPDTDYLDLGYRVRLLSVVLNCVHMYGGGILIAIEDGLDALHGAINDTRAAHLDRTRTKQTVKLTSHRIKYQRKATRVGQKLPFSFPKRPQAASAPQSNYE